MSNLYTFLAGFDPYNEDDEPMCWGDEEPSGLTAVPVESHPIRLRIHPAHPGDTTLARDDETAPANDHARDMAQSELFRHHADDTAEDVTLDLELEQRLDFNATLLAIADARRIQREIDEAWAQHDREEG